jgi:antitoxin MazE
MTARIRKWGNSAAVRIPAALLAEAHIAFDQTVEIREDRGRIIIEPVRRRFFAIRDLIAGIRPDNLHDATETGPPMGGEVW